MKIILQTALLLVVIPVSATEATEYFLTIGGGPTRDSDQASLERNVVFYQQVLKERGFPASQQSIFFASGPAGGNDVQTMQPDALPKANRLMAEFFGSETDLGVRYRKTELADVCGATTRANIAKWFAEVGRTMKSGDRLIIYVTAHGEKSEDRQNPYETSIALWNDEKLPVTDFVALLDQLPSGVSVVAVMVQCYTGGFARMIYDKADPERGLSRQNRCGFFATVHDHEAAGCTPEVDEASYVEYSTYFWEALAGHSRMGKPIAPPDYNGDGKVSFAEAHAYTLLNADTIDMPLTTSSEFLSSESQFKDADHPDLLARDAPYETIHELATPAERAVLDGLSKQLNLTGNNRIEAAQRESRTGRRGRQRGRGPSPRRRASQLRDEIADDLKLRWPELANTLNPESIELVTTRSKEFVDAVENHPKYKEYLDQKKIAAQSPDPQKRRAKYERFIREAEDVILRENLKRLQDNVRLAEYEGIVAAENTFLGGERTAGAPAAGSSGK